MDKLRDNTPFRVGFLLIDGFALMSYSAAFEPLRAANLLAGRQLYDVRHLPAQGGLATSSGGAQVPASAHIGEQVDFDLILVVAGGNPVAFRNARVLRWLRHLASRGVLIGGVSGGPVILARAGIMQGRRMTVHWEHAIALTDISPDLLVERSLYVIDRDRITCAGGIAPLDMMHALIVEHHGEAFATRVSDWFVHTDIRPPGGPQRSGLAERYRTHNQAIISSIVAMENHIADPLELGQLAQLVGLGARQLNRLFTSELGQSTIAFYRSLRLEKARRLLLHSSLSVADIAIATGFAGSAHFSTRYREHFGLAPTASRNRRDGAEVPPGKCGTMAHHDRRADP